MPLIVFLINQINLQQLPERTHTHTWYIHIYIYIYHDVETINIMCKPKEAKGTHG
jgi:hypothetical protein